MENELQTLLKEIHFIERDFLKSAENILKAGRSQIHKLDYFALSVINRSISLNKGFKNLIETENTLSAVSLLRLHLDNLLRYNAILIAKNPLDLTEHILDNKPINTYSEDNKKFSDNYLAKQLDKKFKNSYSLYKHLCNYIHYGYSHVEYIFREKQMKTEESSHQVVIGDCDFFSLKDKIDYADNMLIISKNLLKLTNQWAMEKELFYLP